MWDYESSPDEQQISRSINACNVWKMEDGTIQKQNVELLGHFVQYDGSYFLDRLCFLEKSPTCYHTTGYTPPRHYDGGLGAGDFLQMGKGLALFPITLFEGLCVIFNHTNPHIGHGVLPLTDIHYTDVALETIHSIVGYDSQWTHRELQDELTRYHML